LVRFFFNIYTRFKLQSINQTSYNTLSL